MVAKVSRPEWQRVGGVVMRGALCVFGAFACTHRPAASDSFARVMNPGDSTWYAPPGGCTRVNMATAPPDSLRIPGFFGDTTRDLNAREAAFARIVPGGYGGIWVEGDSFAIALVDTSRRIDAVHALYARGYRVNGDLAKSRAQPVQWDFAQLDDWFNVIVPRAFDSRIVTGAGIDVMRNRIRLNTDVEQRPALRRLLASLGVPCYMVGIERGLRARFP